ncbi:fumarylacetoacetate hydrolase family protein [Thermus tengchongensis]|uniref:fumarylacetoacetate hydrolase family protein n=1 Tax=Thermus tengchongensis TaxID=1214928 RepID=UPI001F44229C|nr:fumarylacetoacetate hydrolase family protein [Thermus tengchongensis]
MKLTRHLSPHGPRWAWRGFWLPEDLRLGLLLQVPASRLEALLEDMVTQKAAAGPLLPPIEPEVEVWASGVTYQRSREARVSESKSGDVYDYVYAADRPELFFKAMGFRVRGSGEQVRIRRDSRWTVPEPEVVLVLNALGEAVGYTAGNDMSARDIEGENPLYLPQAKVYEGACAIGSALCLGIPENLEIRMSITRKGKVVFIGETSTKAMRRSFAELSSWLFRELAFPRGVFLMTGTGIVPPDEFTLASGDHIRIQVGEVSLENEVE